MQHEYENGNLVVRVRLGVVNAMNPIFTFLMIACFFAPIAESSQKKGLRSRTLGTKAYDANRKYLGCILHNKAENLLVLIEGISKNRCDTQLPFAAQLTTVSQRAPSAEKETKSETKPVIR